MPAGKTGCSRDGTSPPTSALRGAASEPWSESLTAGAAAKARPAQAASCPRRICLQGIVLGLLLPVTKPLKEPESAQSEGRLLPIPGPEACKPNLSTLLAAGLYPLAFKRDCTPGASLLSVETASLNSLCGHILNWKKGPSNNKNGCFFPQIPLQKLLQSAHVINFYFFFLIYILF